MTLLRRPRLPPPTASAAPDVKADKPVKSARTRTVKDDAAQNTAEVEQTAQLNKDNSAADRATKNGSVAVPLPAASPSDTASATPLPTPPAPPASSVASTGQPVAPETSAPTQDTPAAPAGPRNSNRQAPAPQPDQRPSPRFSRNSSRLKIAPQRQTAGALFFLEHRPGAGSVSVRARPYAPGPCDPTKTSKADQNWARKISRSIRISCSASAISINLGMGHAGGKRRGSRRVSQTRSCPHRTAGTVSRSSRHSR